MNTSNMDKSYFEVIRPGINTTFQDEGRKIFIMLEFLLVEQLIKEIIYYQINLLVIR